MIVTELAVSHKNRSNIFPLIRLTKEGDFCYNTIMNRASNFLRAKRSKIQNFVREKAVFSA